MKKTMIMLMVAAVMTLLFVPMALAADPNSGNQSIDGDVPAAFTISVSGNISGASFDPENSPWTNTATSLTCSSNVAYTVQVNCDSGANKVAGRLTEWNADAYKATTPKSLFAPMTVKTASGSPTEIAVAPANVGGMTALPAEVAGNYQLDYSNAVGYVDTAATATHTYHQVNTYTIAASI